MKSFLPLLFFTVICIVPAKSQVNGTIPASNETAVAVVSEIVFEFAQPVDPTSVNDDLIYAWGRWSGRMLGTVSLENANHEIHFQPDRAFAYGEMVTIRLPASTQFADGSKLTGGYTLQFWTAPAHSGIDLTEQSRRSTRVSGETFIQSYGAYAGDLNHDGFSDLIIPNERTDDVRVFLNDGAGGYGTDAAIIPLVDGSAPSTNEGADFNRDGHTDFAVGNSTGTVISVLMGDGNGGFTSQETYLTGSGVRGLCTGDFNADGWEDIVTANRAAGKVFVLLNNGDGTFGAATTLEPGGDGESGCAVADYDGDGIEDLFVGNLSSQNISVMKGDGAGLFETMHTISVDGEPWMLAAGDLNGDGVPDIVSANSNGHNVSISLMQQSGIPLSNVHYFNGGFLLAVDLGDIDGDGDLDVATSNFGSKDFTFWTNDGTGALQVYKTMDTTGAGSCLILHDRDGDGDLDATGIDELDDQIIFFENTIEVTGVDGDPRVFEITHVFPNPATEHVTVSYRSEIPQEVEILIYDAIGRERLELMRGAVGAGPITHDVDVSELSAGSYFIVSRSSGTGSVKSLVLVK